MPETIKQDQLQQKLISYRRKLHENPELSMKEYETAKRIKDWLKNGIILHSN